MRLISTSLLVWLVAVAPAWGWSATGHKIIASIAFRQLTPSQQAKIVAILQRHPRLAQDFAEQMPPEINTADKATQNEWLFQQAAIWPDTIRSGPPEKQAFHRPEWHYVNQPRYLTDETKAANLPSILALNMVTEPPADATLETAKMNVTQVIAFAKKTLADKQTVPEARAVMLAWLFHDVGDIHQPLHSTAMFSLRLFPDGDRGGNLIKTRQAFNLHAVWDQFPGSDDSYREARNKAIGYVEGDQSAALGKTAAADTQETAWLAESFALTETAVYTAEILSALRAMEASGQAFSEIDLSTEYLKAGGRAAEQRVIQAGYRLGAVLKQIAGD